MAFILISIGSNIEREQHIRAAIRELQQALGALHISSVYESEAVGFDGDPFYNLVVAAHTDLTVEGCVELFKAIEDQHGRKRNVARFSGRTLDLDLLTYDQLICKEPVELPRDEITKNAFVLWPLAELVPEHIHPQTGLTYRQLWQQYPKQQKLWTVPFSWSET
ncbi:2-amino-4-hydroxy-6-hydroxymethyldihydropteridine diphosphokinase [Alkalimonas sp.]|uniref:2-amino-4-hydroxy-6- hydroxymethyldihydropteridine diphosphokinase n=1 Tax=Alkalimonas sp. TaxID=1872453 RepID=UPI00263A6501|nr:2-amino-4-hydroxy-6-hydroxymethyldihydropteridine diphosphokinase [Alkalimonas sp.]MCC5827420.1 2-amino-4-hydroxy-6-hydroxymethyldihydropteridine diphosphokinase [Alkalimonas sp.]